MIVPRRRSTNAPAELVTTLSIRARIQTGDDRLGDPLGLVRTLHRDGDDARFFSRVVVATDEQGIADQDHLLERQAEDVSQLSDSVRLVDAGFGHIDGRGAAHSDGEPGKQGVEDRLDLLTLRVVGVPLFLLLQGSLLPQRGERDLAPSIFNLLAPESLGLEASL